MAADRMHLHHLLLDLGWSHVGAVWTILGLASVLAASGLAGMGLGVPEFVMFYGFLALFGAFYLTCSALRARIRHEALKAPGDSKDDSSEAA